MRRHNGELKVMKMKVRETDCLWSLYTLCDVQISNWLIQHLYSLQSFRLFLSCECVSFLFHFEFNNRNKYKKRVITPNFIQYDFFELKEYVRNLRNRLVYRKLCAICMVGF